MKHKPDTNDHQHATTSLILDSRPERRLIRPYGSRRFVAFHTHVHYTPIATERERPPLELALVLDRSGSMQGEKLKTAKRAALALLDQLTPRDQVSIVVFDNVIDIVQPLKPVTAAFKREARAALHSIQARANTALHEGWLTGCNTIVAADDAGRTRGVARCFLLTDGLANVGVTDPERIAGEAAGIREHAGISTSTFGIGNDYNELLLGPMAVAGGGQFHHLRTADEITRTFIGELGGLLSIAARQVRLEIEADEGVNIELFSPYWMRSSERGAAWSIAIGDLQRDEERQVVIRAHFPDQGKQDQRFVRARLVWLTDGAECHTDWQELVFAYAGHAACDAEVRDAQVMHWAGLHRADRARRETIARNNRGDLADARAYLEHEVRQINQYAPGDEELQAEVAELRNLQREIARAPMSAASAKEQYYMQQRRSRGQKDYRMPEPE